MIFSKPVTYAIRALLYLSVQEDKVYVLGTTIAKAIGIPAPYLVKILGTLTNGGLLTAVRGPGGGFFLARDPAKITLQQVVDLFEITKLTEQCLLGCGVCDENNSCPIHSRWTKPKSAITEFLTETTVDTLKELLNTSPGKCFQGDFSTVEIERRGA